MSKQQQSKRAERPYERKRSVPAWMVFAVALLIALGTAYAINGLRAHTSEDLDLMLLFEDLETQAYRLSALEWQAVADRQLSSEVAEEVEDTRSQISSTLDKLLQAHLEDEERGHLLLVDEKARTYVEAIDEELRLLETGNVEQALVIDEERVDPSFEELRETLQEAGESIEAHAQQVSRNADWGSTATLVLAACLIGLLFWRFQRAQRLTELLRIQNLEAQAARLKESNRELQDFVRVASHDLQEPLRKVRTFGDRLKTKYADALDDRGRDYLERMDNDSARMQDLIDDLLALSRITSKAQLFESVNLSEVANEVVSDLETSIEEAGGRVEVSNLPTVEADRMQMRQLLQNLIGNALKFHKENEPPIVKVRGGLLAGGREGENGW